MPRFGLYKEGRERLPCDIEQDGQALACQVQIPRVGT